MTSQEEIRKADEDMNRQLVDHHRPEPPQHLPETLPRHNRHLHLKCPRCDSTNTKFCYYNNYSLSQPRYFCKTCRRYWTQGGTLRSVPVGGGCRKGKRAKTSAMTMGATSRFDVNNLVDNHTRVLPPNSSISSLLLGGTNNYSAAGMIGPNSRVKEMVGINSPMQLPPSNYYPSGTNGGFFPSFTSMRSLGHPQPLNISTHQRPNFGALFGIGGGSSNNSSSSNSNMALLQGFNNNNNNLPTVPPPPSMAQQPQYNEQSMFNHHHVINSAPHTIGEPKIINNMDHPYYLYPNMIGSSWNQNLLINNNNNNNNATTDSGAANYVMNPNQWLDHDLHMFNAPPPGF